ncbi:Retrovirus-related Pol polyprotein from type-2 retrotransposable element R2DM [Araneus ventricosus]|uniref:Retrovirus-related Pol polyprotein from type-2 retrotransposable element R2DM n=1 Tax=Araneus ventricosus TaxID=182803 RepID=A0A4Y2X9A5_ARAVE|nr:Retrovirus-related Pol polyprotein from type-2 retrotransposable element R2DM [Araneus ventricosus]
MNSTLISWPPNSPDLNPMEHISMRHGASAQSSNTTMSEYLTLHDSWLIHLVQPVSSHVPKLVKYAQVSCSCLKAKGVQRLIDALNVKVKKFIQAQVNGGSNYDSLKTIAVAVLDMEKAFDSVSHDAIFQALEKINISPVIKDYLKFTYAHARTFLCFNGSIKSEPVRPTRGVRQGDPMSPLLFLMVFDRVLSSIPDYEGFHIEGKKINHIAFADDLVLMADSMIGLNNIINKILPALIWSGLNISVEKSATFMWMADGKRKRVIYDSTSRLSIRNRPVNIFKVDDEFKYLGVIFTPRGRIKYNVDLEEKLRTLQKALLRPQQKMFFLVNNLLPGLYHQLSFAKLYAGSLRRLGDL